MVTIFTDSSFARGRCTVAYFILEDCQFLGYNVSDAGPATSSLYGEMTALVKALEFLHETYPDKTEDIIIQSDSYDMWQVLMNKEVAPKSCMELLNRIRVFEASMSITFKVIRGHKEGINGNKIVDLSCGIMQQILNKRRGGTVV